jgi:hypothetical protein
VESTVFVFSVHDAEDRRRVITAHLRATRNKRGEPAIETRLDEHAITPADRIPRVIEGVLRRMGDEFSNTPPSHCRIDSSAERWRELVDFLTTVPKGETLPEELLPESRASAGEEFNEVDD